MRVSRHLQSADSGDGSRHLRVGGTSRMRKRRALLLTKYDEAGASSRYRVYTYLQFMQDHGWDTTVEPLLLRQYVAHLYRSRARDAVKAMQAMSHRALYLLRSRFEEYDVIFIQYEVFPHLPYFIESS